MSTSVRLGVVVLVLLAWWLRPRKQTSATTPDLESDPTPLQVAYHLELLALAMASGAPGSLAVAAVARSSGGRVGEQLDRVSAAMAWGVDSYQAFAAVSSGWAPAARAFNVATRAGAGPSALLRAAAHDLRTEETHRVQTAAAKAGVRIVLPLGLCFLPAFLVLTIVPLVIGMIRL